MDKQTDLDNHKKVIATFINCIRNSRDPSVMADIVDSLHAQNLHLVVVLQKGFEPATFEQIMINPFHHHDDTG